MVVSVSSTSLRYQQQIEANGFQFLADEPNDLGGDNTGPKPTDYILAGLGSCKAITVKMYAERKGWDLQGVSLELEKQIVDRHPQILVTLQFEGTLNTEQTERLQAIANKCPMHKLLAGTVDIQTQLVKVA